ncbi:uncharacterized protein LOC123318338 [Coccinella septempunctata]|uniref:uncharacterized protein LOC123318338 n=2 Tax=Coccinella septempunctata TaxID=41139 RepID=UPI001D08A6D2|nr:uncharacterized protein LOC123318338 [Coccinella septempunctata]
MSAVSTNQALLSTALVRVTNKDKTFILRALLDCGSQSSFISYKAQQNLGIYKIKKYHQYISGLGNMLLNVNEHCNINIQSLHNNFNMNINCFILPKITDNVPHCTLRIENLGVPSSLHLADPGFHQPSVIDLLLGADIFWDLLKPNRLILGHQGPILQETYLGWIVAGPMRGNTHDKDKNTKIYCHFSKEISKQLAKFWELEEIPRDNKNLKNNYCENLFSRTTHREHDGRFCVRIPLKESSSVLGDSYKIAEKRLMQLEEKFKRKPVFKEEYRKFIREYEQLGHMTEIPKPIFGCYLPHHAVLKETSETTKLRVVFDASAKTSTGISLNDIQYIGPVVQNDLFSILLRYRQHKFVVSADVEKMYRQILVEPEQRILQLILWHDDPTQTIRVFRLNTVTYGTASAPFLSTRCLHQLGLDCNDCDEVVSKCIKDDFYIDDLLSGTDDPAELIHIVQSITEILRSAGLPLRRWRTNCPSIFQFQSNISTPKDLDVSSPSSVLGLKWDPLNDILQFSVENINLNKNVTKRTILSNSAKLFDPLGLLSPCTIVPKIILQKLWQSKLGWDDPVDDKLESEWRNFTINLNTVSKVGIGRHILINQPVIIELHSFSDASQAAYAAAIYLRSIDSSGNIFVKLVCAKTRVAPVKPTTIPRLELCGALLSARLSSKVAKSLRCDITSSYHWTDSTIVLGWLSSEACNLQPFVANRVSEVQELTASGTWRHVPGDKNPADMASRGVNPKCMQSATLWWEGPPFLFEDPCSWPQTMNTKNILDLPEKKTTAKCLHATTTLNSTIHVNSLINFDKYSRFSTLQRSVAYVLRFISNSRNKVDKFSSSLSTVELHSSLQLLIKLHQRDCFLNEIRILSNKQNLPSYSRMLSLSPFLDENGILRVGGRIQKSKVSYDRKHPALLDINHNFTKLLFSYHHIKLMHCGPQLLLSDLRNEFWPLRGRILARSTINNCKICRIMKAKCLNPLMGNLPASRVIPSSPFQVSGVDFGGPFYITDRKGRGCKITKCYLCLFVCFATKALHLEVASDLTSDVFILCLRRFISRRGKPLQLLCDNGTNFVGAGNEIARFLKTNNEEISGFAANEGINFKFSPAYSPHFGGLWEAGIKSAKYHITRILGDKHLTFEELTTLFTQIEAILNSRPLTPLSSDPTDLNPLTPAHFLIGRPLTSLPVENLLQANPNRLSRFQNLESMRQHFWHRWKNEYLSELQQRSKWRIKQEGLKEGDLVVIKEANVPPLKWRMARVSKLFPGSDGVSRVAELYTSKGIIRRAVHNLCSLPVPPTAEVPRSPKGFEGGEDV